MQFIPAIDLIGGRCVRLTKGRFSTAKDYGDPIHVVRKIINMEEFRRIHIVDLDGARIGCPVHTDILDAWEAKNFISYYGGGIRNLAYVRKICEHHPTIVVLGTRAIESPRFLGSAVKAVGGHRIAVSFDVKNKQVMVRGWTKKTTLNIYDGIASALEKRVGTIIVTDIERDGTMAGPNVELARRVVGFVCGQAHVIYAGGVRMEDRYKLQETGLFGAIIGKSLMEELYPTEKLPIDN